MPESKLNVESVLGVGVELGINRLLDPNWALGVVSSLATNSLGDFPGITALGVRITYMWTLGDPFAP